MKTLRNVWNSFSILIGIMITSTLPVLAVVDTTQTYRSGWLVLAFIGFFAAIVLMQAVPAIILFVGMVKSTFAKKNEQTVDIKVD